MLSVDVLIRASSIVTLPIYLRLMTQDEYGLYTYLLSILGAFSLIANFGLYTAQSKLFHEYSGDDRGRLLFNEFLLLVALFVIFVVGLFAFRGDEWVVSILFANHFSYHSYRWVVLLGLFVNAYGVMVFNYFVISEQIRLLQLFNIIKMVAVNGAALLMMLFIPGDHAFLRMSVSFVVEFAILGIFSISYFKAMRPRFDKGIVARSLKIGLPVMVGFMAGLVMGIADRFVLEKRSNLSGMAVYNLGYTLANIIGLVATSFNNVWLPFFFKEKDPAANFKKTGRVSLIYMSGLLVLCALIWIATFGLIKIGIIQREYLPTLGVLPLLLIAQCIQAVSHMYSNYFAFYEVTYLSAIYSFVLSGVALCSNLGYVRGGRLGPHHCSFVIWTVSRHNNHKDSGDTSNIRRSQCAI